MQLLFFVPTAGLYHNSSPELCDSSFSSLSSHMLISQAAADARELLQAKKTERTITFPSCRLLTHATLPPPRPHTMPACSQKTVCFWLCVIILKLASYISDSESLKKKKKKTGPNSKGARETLVECILMPRPMPCLFYRNWSGVSLKFNGFFLCHVPPLHQVSWNSVRLLLHNVADGQEDKPTESNMQQTQWKTCFSCSISKETLEESSSKALLNMPMAPTHSDITILYALLVFTID